MDDFIASQGWQCPICKTVYSPNTPVCFYCNPNSTRTTATTVPQVCIFNKDDNIIWLNRSQEYYDGIIKVIKTIKKEAENE